MRKETEYAFPVAKIKAKEKSLLSNDKLQQMIDAKTLEDALKIASEAGYALQDAMTGTRYEKVFSEVIKITGEEIKKIIPDPDIIKIFLLKYDYHNLKCMIKAEYLGTDCTDILVNNGTIEISNIVNLYKERNFAAFYNEIMANAVKGCFIGFNKTMNPQVIDVLLDKAMYQNMLQIAKELKSKYLSELIGLYADLNNLRSFIRIRRINRDGNFLSQVLLPGGKVTYSVFTQLLNAEESKITEVLSKKLFKDVTLDGITNPENKGKLSELEKYTDDKIMDFIRTGRLKAFGIEPIVGYYLAKENEIKNIRIIIVGKANGIAPNSIRERIRKAYA